MSEMSASEDNPFGNLLPFLLAEDGESSNSALALMIMNQNSDIDPMTLMMLSGKGNGLNMYLMYQMMNKPEKLSEHS